MMVADPGQTPLEQVQSRELAQEIVTAVEALPLEQRGAFVMFAQAGLSLEEIAEATGVDRGDGQEPAALRPRQAAAGARGGKVGPCLITTPQTGERGPIRWTRPMSRPKRCSTTPRPGPRGAPGCWPPWPIEPVAADAPPAPRRAAWRRGGWLVAASVAGLSVLVAQQIPSPFPGPQPPAPPAVASLQSPTPSPAPADRTARAEAPAAAAPTPPAPRATPPASSAAKVASPIAAPEQPIAAPPPPQPAPAPPALSVPPVEHRIEEPRPPAAAAARAMAPAAATLGKSAR